jgi:bifunctional UDP-N-acetylglucosamine pyrophosphorylase/glucosamine-1-phosphate N-acetyltransferase
MLEWRGKPLVRWVTDALGDAGITRTILVIGHKGEMIEEAFTGEPVETVWQHERLGTAHAVLQAEPLLKDHDGHILVLLGDAPCIQGATIRDLIARHIETDAAATILTAELSDPTGYGRVVADADGVVDRIVEHRDASEEIRQIREINSGMICFKSQGFFELIHSIGNDNEQKEYYLTDAISLLRETGHKVQTYRAADPKEVVGVNTLEQLEALG